MEAPQPGQQMTPEQIEALKEKLAKMSPEELKEFQKKQCVFCQIIAEKIKSKKVFEDDKVIAILDINPAGLGHILLMPKEHYSIMPQIPDEEISHIFIVSKALSNAVLRVIESSGTNIFVANGPAAGQKAQHFMLHIIPRKDKDNIKFELPQKKISEDELEAIKSKMAARLAPTKKGEKAAAEAEFKPQVDIKKMADALGAEKKGKPKKEPKRTKETKESIDLDSIAKLLGGEK